jgi:hypothetical protein
MSGFRTTGFSLTWCRISAELIFAQVTCGELDAESVVFW